MSKQLINEYRADLDRLRTTSGSRRESVLREAFKGLLKRWGKAQGLIFIPEHDIVTPQRNRIYLDGALLHALRVPFGYWEAKDADDDLDAEIAAKTRKGYPRDNIVYSDDHVAVLIQDGSEITRVAMDDTDALYALLTRFFAHERREIADFNTAVKQFAADLPAVLTALRDIIAEKRAASAAFARAEADFLKHAQDAINPAVSEDDVQEMLIQHILTEDIFAKVFDNPDFHDSNNVAKELKRLEGVLFGYGEKQRLLRGLQPFYAGISRTAAVIDSHSEKQGFLKGLYENFYKVYNAKAADRLGVVYTPGEIVRFMIRSADWLCERHFGKNLIDRGVEILDPATGTGTFIVELLEHFRGDHAKLRHKYKEELHANEVAILPYYVANLNIEATYQAITGQFAEFPGLVLVDTLDNFESRKSGKGNLAFDFGQLSDENLSRLQRQNKRKISVILGNPPYNAWQSDYNQRNANRPYEHVDRRIGETYRRLSTARNTSSLSDMWVRFSRWCSDRLQGDGILAFICNRNFIDKIAFDGFRKTIAEEFSECWVMDLGGDVRANPKLSGTKHNVFGIQTGVAMVFLVRNAQESDFTLHYARRPEEETAADKLSFLQMAQSVSGTGLTTLKPDAKGNWLSGEGDDWDKLLPLADPARGPEDTIGANVEKASDGGVEAIFRLSTNGVKTQRDEWVWALERKELSEKAKILVADYESNRKVFGRATSAEKASWQPQISVKWDRELERYLRSDIAKKFERSREVRGQFRPFIKGWLYLDPHFVGMPYRVFSVFRSKGRNRTITVDGVAADYFCALGVDAVFDKGLTKTGNGNTRGVPRYRYTKSGERVDNITHWALRQFNTQYPPRKVRARSQRTPFFTTSTPFFTIRSTAKPMP